MHALLYSVPDKEVKFGFNLSLTPLRGKIPIRKRISPQCLDFYGGNFCTQSCLRFPCWCSIVQRFHTCSLDPACVRVYEFYIYQSGARLVLNFIGCWGICIRAMPQTTILKPLGLLHFARFQPSLYRDILENKREGPLDFFYLGRTKLSEIRYYVSCVGRYT